MPTRRTRLLLLTGLVPILFALAVIALAGRAAQDDLEQDVAGPAAIVQPRQGPFRGGPLPKGIDRAPAPQFALRDAGGRPVSTRSLSGRPYLVTFLYTDCQDVCPLIGQEVKQAIRQLGRRGRDVTALAVTADPESDTPQAVKAWLQTQRMPENFRYLLGTRDELQPIWKAHYAAPQPDDQAASAHSASIWLVDRAGRWRSKFSGGVPVPPRDIAHDLRLLLGEAG